MRHRHLRAVCAGAAVTIATLAMGCTTGAYGEVAVEYPAVHAEVVPSNVHYYPRTYYGGRTVYLVDGRWYYPYRNQWVVYQREPIELQRYRVRYYDRYGYGYRPAYRHGRYYRAPQLHSAPPPPRGPYHPYPPAYPR